MPELTLDKPEIVAAGFAQLACVGVPAMMDGMAEDPDALTATLESLLERTRREVASRSRRQEHRRFLVDRLAYRVLPSKKVLAAARERGADTDEPRLAALAAAHHDAFPRNVEDQVRTF